MSQADKQKLYTLKFEHRPKYLYVFVEGEKDNYEISRAYWQEIADYLKKTEFERVLVDENILEPSSVIDVFQLVSDFPKMGFSGIQIAFHDRQISHQELSEFGELVASNRGLNARVFNDPKLAEDWIGA